MSFVAFARRKLENAKWRRQSRGPGEGDYNERKEAVVLKRKSTIFFGSINSSPGLLNNMLKLLLGVLPLLIAKNFNFTHKRGNWEWASCGVPSSRYVIMLIVTSNLRVFLLRATVQRANCTCVFREKKNSFSVISHIALSFFLLLSISNKLLKRQKFSKVYKIFWVHSLLSHSNVKLHKLVRNIIVSFSLSSISLFTTNHGLFKINSLKG